MVWSGLSPDESTEISDQVIRDDEKCLVVAKDNANTVERILC